MNSTKKEKWWKDYRRRQYKPRVKLSTEMIFLKAVTKTFKEYCNDCSIRVIKQMFDPDIGLFERFFWVILFCITFGGIVYFLHYLWFDGLNRPLVVSMESSTYPISKIDFPAVALCNINRISKKAVTSNVRKEYPEFTKYNLTFQDIEKFNTQSGSLIDYKYDKSLLKNPLIDEMPKYKYKPQKIIDTMEMFAPNCKEMLEKCFWAGKEMDCMEIFAVRRTVRGHCCIFNYVLYFNTTSLPTTKISNIKKQNHHGPLKGLIVIMDPLVNDYAYPLYNMQGFEVLLFDPTHFADPSAGRVIQRIAEPNQVTFFQLRSIKQVATSEVRKYHPKTRKCLFRDEKNKKFGDDMYSYNACIVNCRRETVLSLCKCVPYFLPMGSRQEAVCTLEDLRCLHKYKEKLLYLYPVGAVDTNGLETEFQDSMFCPDCLPDCEFTQHYTSSFQTLLNEVDDISTYSRKPIFDGVNLTNKCILSISQPTGTGTLDRLDVVLYWFEILSNVGGVSGILIGFCIIAIAEGGYFLIIRFVQNFCTIYLIHRD